MQEVYYVTVTSHSRFQSQCLSEEALTEARFFWLEKKEIFVQYFFTINMALYPVKSGSSLRKSWESTFKHYPHMKTLLSVLGIFVWRESCLGAVFVLEEGFFGGGFTF